MLRYLYFFTRVFNQKWRYFQAKTCKQLWVGGISPAVTKEDLEADFRKFGKVDDFKFFRDRNTACVEFFNLDDAIQAMKIMNGKRIGGENIRVDFLRSNYAKRVSLYFRMLILFVVTQLPYISYFLWSHI